VGAEPELLDFHSKRADGWKSPADVLKSYRELEQKATWSDAVRLPKEGADPKAWDEVWNKLGRPATPSPDAYGLKSVEGADAKVAERLAQAFHAGGLNPKQAQPVIDAILELSSTDGDDAARAAKNTAEHHALRSEWGVNYDANVELARRAARAMGVDREALSKIEETLGTRFVFERFAAAGEFLREDAGVDPTGVSGGGGKESALAEITALRANPEWVKRKESDNYDVAQAAGKELSELYRKAYGDQ
jgi:hypothetical protein